jgi:hypothetical protein
MADLQKWREDDRKYLIEKAKRMISFQWAAL